MSKKIRYMYLRDGDKNTNTPFGVIAILVDNNNNTVSYGVSVVNTMWGDRFNRDFAKDLAVGRLVNKSPLIHLADGSVSCHEITKEVFTCMLREDKQHHNLPARAKKAVKRWLDTKKTGSKKKLSITTKFHSFMSEIEAEARKEGLAAVQELEALRNHFRTAREEIVKQQDRIAKSTYPSNPLWR